MSISNSLANALSGLNALSRRTEVVSSNIANAQTEGYARREVNLSAQSLGGHGAGVRVDAVTRAVDLGILSDRRLAQSSFGDAAAHAAFFERLEQAIGTPDQPGSLGDLVAAFDAALTEASSRPDSEIRLGNVLEAASGMTRRIRDIAGGIQQSRIEADRQISQQVASLNETLGRVADLNREITAKLADGYDTTALMDQRQRLVDDLAELVPLRQVERDNGQIALFSTSGAVLLDGRPAEFDFTPTSVITEDMTVQSGALSGLTLNGTVIDTTSTASLLRGGALIANFAIRDDLATNAQTDLDALARNLVERFQDPATDPTLGASDPGLFTDGGSFFDPVNEPGLSSRLSINAAVDPAQGGGTWRLRDGLGAAAPGDPGDGTILQNLSNVMALAQQPVSGGITQGARSFSGLVSDFLSTAGVSRTQAEADIAYAQTRTNLYSNLELQNGVDTDREMQELLMIESAFAANARVMKAADEMVKLLLGV